MSYFIIYVAVSAEKDKALADKEKVTSQLLEEQKNNNLVILLSEM